MAMLRMILIRFLQGVTEQPDYPKRLERARRELFPVIPRVCEWIKRDFPE